MSQPDSVDTKRLRELLDAARLDDRCGIPNLLADGCPVCDAISALYAHAGALLDAYDRGAKAERERDKCATREAKLLELLEEAQGAPTLAELHARVREVRGPEYRLEYHGATGQWCMQWVDRHGTTLYRNRFPSERACLEHIIETEGATEDDQQKGETK